MKKADIQLIEFFKKDKKRAILAVAALLGMALAVFLSSSDKSGVSEGYSLSEYKSELEGELAEMCSSIKGVGRCRVTVSFSEGESLEYKGSALIGSKPPRVLGVCVICDGADREGVKGEICECMRSLFDIGSNRISVMKMK